MKNCMQIIGKILYTLICSIEMKRVKENYHLNNEGIFFKLCHKAYQYMCFSWGRFLTGTPHTCNRNLLFLCIFDHILGNEFPLGSRICSKTVLLPNACMRGTAAFSEIDKINGHWNEVKHHASNSQWQKRVQRIIQYIHVYTVHVECYIRAQHLIMTNKNWS